MKIIPVITIDGPSGAGKGTLCKALAEIFQWHLLDSGAIYRSLALTVLQNQLAIDSEEMLVQLTNNLDVCFKIEQGQLKVFLDGKCVSQDIRGQIISNITSKIAMFPRVREALMWRQRAFRTIPGLITDGRDMGTVVFPDAQLKIFLIASLKERAYRRMLQLQKIGFNVSFKMLLSEIKERDDRDRHRKIAPLVPAIDALVLDSTYLTIDEVIVKTLSHAKNILSLAMR